MITIRDFITGVLPDDKQRQSAGLYMRFTDEYTHVAYLLESNDALQKEIVVKVGAIYLSCTDFTNEGRNTFNVEFETEENCWLLEWDVKTSHRHTKEY